jgi:hypothetical protein
LEIFSLKLPANRPHDELPLSLASFLQTMVFPCPQPADLKIIAKELQNKVPLPIALQMHFSLSFDVDYLRSVQKSWELLREHQDFFSVTILYSFLAWQIGAPDLGNTTDGVSALMPNFAFLLKSETESILHYTLCAMYYCLSEYLRSCPALDLPAFLLWISQFLSTSLSYPSACLSLFPPALQAGQTHDGDLTASGAALCTVVSQLCQDDRVPFLEKFVGPIVEALLCPLNRLILPALSLYSRLSRFLSEEANRRYIAVLGNSFRDWLCKQPVCQTVSRRELPPIGVCESVFRFWPQSPVRIVACAAAAARDPRSDPPRRSPAARADRAARD